LALAACNSEPTATPTPISQPTPTNPAAGTPRPQTPATITFDTSGGIAGIHKTLEITPQAEATYTSGVTIKKQNLDATTYSALLQQVDAADFFSLKDNYDKGGVADDIYYSVTVKEPRRSKTVKVAQVGGKALAPQGLRDLIAQLNTIQAPLEK